MQNKGKYYITTAIAYTSGKPHIGNTYEIVLADAIARYKRADGYDVHFQTGSDEHGQKIETRAIEEGMSPKEFVDMTAAEIRRIMEEEDGTPWQESDASKIPQPQFLKEIREKEKLSAAAMGSVYHLVLASLDLTGPCTRQSVQALLETMVNCDRIQKEEASRLEVGKIMAFLSSGLAGRMQAAARREKLWREAPFVVSKSAAGIRPEWSADEQVLIQGIIDAFFIEEDQVILTWLYSLSLQKAIRVDLQGP